ncbi:MAG: hypothetical protein ACLSG5_14905 [Oscillospiraceae bacterium]
MNEKNKHAALTIAQQYPPAQYNLVPMQTVTEIADIKAGDELRENQHRPQ